MFRIDQPWSSLRIVPGLLALLAGFIALSLPLAWAAPLILGPLAVWIALRDPAGALYLAVLSVPFQELVALPGGLSLTQVALLLAVASLALHTLSDPERPLAFGRLFVPLLGLVWALGLATAFTPYSQAEAVRETVRWATVPLIYLLALRATEGAAWRTWGLVACLLVAPVATALLGLVQFWFGLGPASFEVGGGRVRAYGTIGQPNSFAGYMNQAWPLAAGVALFALVSLWRGTATIMLRTSATKFPDTPLAQPSQRTLGVQMRSNKPPCPLCLCGESSDNLCSRLLSFLGAGAATGILGAALLASFSRGGWVGAVGGSVALGAATVWLLPPAAWPLLRRLAVGGGIGLVLVGLLGSNGLLPAALTGRAASLVGNLRLFDARGTDITAANFAVVERMAHLQAAWQMFERYPLTGVGPGNYTLAYERPPGPDEAPMSVRPWYESRGHAHNYYLHMAAEAGIIGLGAYLLLLGLIWLQALRTLAAVRSAGWAWRGIAAGACGVVAAVMVHNLFENLHVLNMGLQLGSIWALLVIVERKQ